MTQLKFRIKFLDEILGTAPNNKIIHEEYIGSKAEDAPKIEEEVAAIGVDEKVNKEMTVFPRMVDGDKIPITDKDGNFIPIMWDYQFKGFIKESCGALRDIAGKDEDTGKKKAAITACGKLTAYKTKIDKNVFVYPRQIPFTSFLITDMGDCQRPLRAETAQGPRVALANSETIPAGAEIELEILCMNDEHVAMVIECLSYGILKGTGQWRNSGKGRFDFEELSREELPVTALMDKAFRTKWKEALTSAKA